MTYRCHHHCGKPTATSIRASPPSPSSSTSTDIPTPKPHNPARCRHSTLVPRWLLDWNCAHVLQIEARGWYLLNAVSSVLPWESQCRGRSAGFFPPARSANQHQHQAPALLLPTQNPRKAPNTSTTTFEPPSPNLSSRPPHLARGQPLCLSAPAPARYHKANGQKRRLSGLFFIVVDPTWFQYPDSRLPRGRLGPR